MMIIYYIASTSRLTAFQVLNAYSSVELAG